MTRALLTALLAVAACGDSSPTTAAPDMSSPVGPDGISITLTSITVMPGDEKIVCQYVPPDGKERWLKTFDVHLSPGSHHLVVFRNKDDTGTAAWGPTPCLQTDTPPGFDGMLPGSQEQHAYVPLPDGVAMHLEADHGLYFQEHFINATTKPLTTNVTWQAIATDPSTVKQEAGIVFYSQWELDVPTGMSTQSMTRSSPQDMNLIYAAGHMHKHGLTFDADVAGTPIYHTANWDEPASTIFPQPGFAVKKGDALRWACAYNNDTGAHLPFGNSAATNEMCILLGMFYPVVGGNTTLF